MTCIIHRTVPFIFSDKLIPVNKKRFKVLKVERKCTLAEFIEQKKLAFQSGRVFYEFTRKEEDINSEKEVILMDKVATYSFYYQAICIIKPLIYFRAKTYTLAIKHVR